MRTTTSPRRGKLFVIWGGQFGSEGKGQIASHILENERVNMAVRIGGPNAGHTFYYHGVKVVVQSLPIGAYYGAEAFIGSAGLIIPELLGAELQRCYEVTGQPARLTIDETAMVITPEHMNAEAEIKGRIGSTGEGVGAAMAEKLMRKAGVTVADSPLMKETLLRWSGEPWGAGVGVGYRTSTVVNSALRAGATVMVEGTQGAGLSLHTSGYYPYCTSRECTPIGILGEAGINPYNASWVESVMVVRTFPIRVGGTSGPLPHEISWEVLQQETGGYVLAPEITTVTRKIRRIGRFDSTMVQRSALLGAPTMVALTFADYIVPAIAQVGWEGLNDQDSTRLAEFIRKVEEITQAPVGFLAYGPGKTVSFVVGEPVDESR